jgi:DUF1680 family protein
MGELRTPQMAGCCSGSYFQNLADYHNLIYYKDASGPFVNLFLPSEVTWKGPDGLVRATLETSYPESDTATLRLAVQRPTSFTLPYPRLDK